MADNYLEKHYEEYLKRKAAWEKTRRTSVPKSSNARLKSDDDE